jgi:hypothetical protein
MSAQVENQYSASYCIHRLLLHCNVTVTRDTETALGRVTALVASITAA